VGTPLRRGSNGRKGSDGRRRVHVLQLPVQPGWRPDRGGRAGPDQAKAPSKLRRGERETLVSAVYKAQQRRRADRQAGRHAASVDARVPLAG
jgi:hypothetical protein